MLVNHNLNYEVFEGEITTINTKGDKLSAECWLDPFSISKKTWTICMHNNNEALSSLNMTTEPIYVEQESEYNFFLGIKKEYVFCPNPTTLYYCYRYFTDDPFVWDQSLNLKCIKCMSHVMLTTSNFQTVNCKFFSFLTSPPFPTFSLYYCGFMLMVCRNGDWTLQQRTVLILRRWSTQTSC